MWSPNRTHPTLHPPKTSELPKPSMVPPSIPFCRARPKELPGNVGSLGTSWIPPRYHHRSMGTHRTVARNRLNPIQNLLKTVYKTEYDTNIPHISSRSINPKKHIPTMNLFMSLAYDSVRAVHKKPSEKRHPPSIETPRNGSVSARFASERDQLQDPLGSPPASGKTNLYDMLHSWLHAHDEIMMNAIWKYLIHKFRGANFREWEISFEPLACNTLQSYRAWPFKMVVAPICSTSPLPY